MRETFIIRTEWIEAIRELEPADQLIIYNNIFYYHEDRENLIILNNLSVKLVWKFIEQNLRRNIENYDKRKETSIENGKKGGRPHKEKSEEIGNNGDLQGNNLNNPENNLNKPNNPNIPVFVPVPIPDPIPTPVPDSGLSSFDDFWILYDKKTSDKSKTKKKWDSLNIKVHEKIFAHIPLYKLSQPDKQYRKDPLTYLNQLAWENEIIPRNGSPSTQQNGRELSDYEKDLQEQREKARMRYANTQAN